MSTRGAPHHRSRTGHHILLPADSENMFVNQIAISSGRTIVVSWSFGSGTVIWKIWPAILLHTAFAALITTLSLRNTLGFSLGIPNIMMTVLGVVIGFVLSYRVSTGYDRYWLGRTYWSDIVRGSRTLSRLIWFHVPLMLSHTTPANDIETEEVTERVMREKRMALDLVEGFAVALKHHLRGEYGIYYEDLYPLVQPLHEIKEEASHTDGVSASGVSVPTVQSSVQASPANKLLTVPGADPVIPPVNSWGGSGPQIKVRKGTNHSIQSNHSSVGSSDTDEHAPLLPSSPYAHGRDKFGREVIRDLIPFITFFSWFHRLFSRSAREQYRREQLLIASGYVVSEASIDIVSVAEAQTAGQKPVMSSKHRRYAKEFGLGIGSNIPVEIIRSLSEYFSVLEARTVVPGTSLGSMLGLLQGMEDSLSGLERILTTPLPWAYTVHIRHCIWTYLFCLPFQLIDQFGWYTIPGTALATFFFLGFLAAGEEIEQPFGYDENDLDIDNFIEVVHAEIDLIKATPGPNAIIPHHEQRKKRRTVAESCHRKAEKAKAKRKHHDRQSLKGVFAGV